MMSRSCVSWVGMAEILSTEIRSTGHAAANAVARLGCFFAPLLIANESSQTIGITMLCISIFATVCVMRLPETKGRAMVGVVDAETDESSTTEIVVTRRKDGRMLEAVLTVEPAQAAGELA